MRGSTWTVPSACGPRACQASQARFATSRWRDSWTTDAHKWLNVPYDSGLAIVAHPAPHRAAMSLHASYLIRGGEEERVGMDWVPESSRRARVIPIYALLRSLGRAGLQEMIQRTCTLASRLADALGRESRLEILNEVVLNQVLATVRSGQGRDQDDALTREWIARVQQDGTCWAGGAIWQGRQVMRISVSNWSTTERDIDLERRGDGPVRARTDRVTTRAVCAAPAQAGTRSSRC